MKKMYIYESPDGGKTVYKRPFGKDGPKELCPTYLINKKKVSDPQSKPFIVDVVTAALIA